jgi:hypothetical protein
LTHTCELCLLQKVNVETFVPPMPFAKNYWASIGVLVPSWLRAECATNYMRRSINQPFVMEVIMIMC